MLLHALLVWTALLVPSSLAVFADDAYHVDYHYALLGAPQQEATFFHAPYSGSKASLIYTLSDKHILGAVNPKDGTTVWRQELTSASNASEALLRAGGEQDSVVTALQNEVTAWSASDGRVAWNQRFHGETVKDLEILELEDIKSSSGVKDVIALFDGSSPVVRRLDGKSGYVMWSHEGNSGDVPFQVSATATHVYYIHYSESRSGIKLKLASLDPLSGQVQDRYSLSSDSDLSSPQSVLFVGANSACPLLVWTDSTRKTLKVNVIGTKNIASFDINSDDPVQEVAVRAPSSINAVSHFLVQYQSASSHWAEVYHVDQTKGSVSNAYDLPKLTGRGTFTISTSGAMVYFTRITQDEMIVVSSASHGLLGRWPVKDYAVPGLNMPDRRLPFGLEAGDVEMAYPVHAVSEVAARAGIASAVRSAVYLSTGDWVLVRNGETIWHRPEALAGVTSAGWCDLPEEESLAHELEIEGHKNVVSAYIHRVNRHLKDLERFPTWLQSLPDRVLASLTGKKTISVKDSFGLHKHIWVQTENGRIITLDPGNSGEIVSNVKHAGPGAEEQSLQHKPSTKGTLTYTMVEGELVGSLPSKKHSEVLWRFTPETGELIVNVTARPREDPVASIGKVLGDRRVLYKYLNPNLILVITARESTNTVSVYLLDSISGDVLYSTSHSSIDVSRPIASTVSENWFAYSLTKKISDSTLSQGYELIVSELYESSIPNDRGPLDDASNSSSFQPARSQGDPMKLHVYTQSYHIPEEISHMSVTQTRQGITSRHLLVTLPESNSIVGIPRMFIDPRRPVGRDPTKDEQMEGLAKYHPVIEFDPKWYLNHKREVLGIRNVITSPALLESTSLVFAYGLDVFGTRVSPSGSFDILGKDFNKLQMLGTVAALFVGVVFVAPLVQRKQTNARWQS